VPEAEFALCLTSEPFPVPGHKRIAVKFVGDVPESVERLT
jgi:hypothetical protein